MSAPPEGRGAATVSFDGAAPSPTDARLPALPARYALGRELGRGGMAVVYAAHDHQLGRDVAVKQLGGDDPRQRLRFAREARLVAALRHPSIVTIHDVDPDGEYLIMELVDGGSIADRLTAGRVAPADARRWTGELIAALAAAHAAGVIHRDVKPSNLLVTRTGALKLADFGIATVGDPALTAEHARVGTPAYMAPEQLRGDARAPTVDVWAAGATIYELFTGVRFVDRGPAGREVAAALRRAGAEDVVAAAIARATADEPAARFADAGAMARALVRPPRRRGLWIGVPLVAVALVGAWALVREPARARAPLPPRLALLGFADTSGDPQLDYASYGLPHLLGNELHAVPELPLIDYQELRPLVVGDGDDDAWRRAAATRGATLIVDGTVEGRTPALRVTVRLRDVDGRELARWTRPATAGEVPRTLRDLAPQIAGAALGRPVTLAPPDAAAALARGIDALARTDLATAEEELSVAVARAPGNAEAAYYRAVALWWRGASAEVLRDAVAAIAVADLAPARRDAIAGLTLFIDHRYTEAIAWFTAALARHPGDRDLGYGLFEARFHGGDPIGAVEAFRALRVREPRFGLGALHVFDFAIVHDDDALVAYALDLAQPDVRALWSAEVAIHRGHPEAAARDLQTELDRPHAPTELDRYIQRTLVLTHALQGHLAFAQALVPTLEAWPLAWAIAESVGDRGAITAAETAYLAQRASTAPGGTRMSLALEATVLALAAGRPREELRGFAERLATDTPSDRRGDATPRIVRVLLALAREDDDALVAEDASGATPEARDAVTGGRAERAGDLAAAVAAWTAARALTTDARLAVLEDLTIARLARARGDRSGLAAACARVLRPGRMVEAWGPAAPRCRAWLAEVTP